MNLAGRIEQLLANLGQPTALAHAVMVREEATRARRGWSHDQFWSMCLHVEHLIASGDLHTAYTIVDQLYQRSQAMGGSAYIDAAYDIASGIGQLCDQLWQAIQQNGISAGVALLAQVVQQVTGTSEVPVILHKLQAILAGTRDPALADDLALGYSNVAEVLLLIERLGAAANTTTDLGSN